MTKAVYAAGGHIVLQLWHVEPIPTPRALETAEIPAIVEQYAQAARNALAAGFDGVEPPTVI